MAVCKWQGSWKPEGRDSADSHLGGGRQESGQSKPLPLEPCALLLICLTRQASRAIAGHGVAGDVVRAPAVGATGRISSGFADIASSIELRSLLKNGRDTGRHHRRMSAPPSILQLTVVASMWSRRCWQGPKTRGEESRWTGLKSRRQATAQCGRPLPWTAAEWVIIGSQAGCSASHQSEPSVVSCGVSLTILPSRNGQEPDATRGAVPVCAGLCPWAKPGVQSGVISKRPSPRCFIPGKGANSSVPGCTQERHERKITPQREKIEKKRESSKHWQRN